MGGLVKAAHGYGKHWLKRHGSAARTKNTYLSAQYHRIAARRGANRAAVAVGHTILIIVYHILKEGVTYKELGANYYDEKDRAATVRRAVRRIEKLGYKVTIEPAAA